MEIIEAPRGFGKTRWLLYKSQETRYPILVGTNSDKEYLIENAKQHGINIPTPISVSELRVGNIMGYDYFKINDVDKVLVDELPHVLSILIGVDVEMATMTSSSRESYDRKKFIERL